MKGVTNMHGKWTVENLATDDLATGEQTNWDYAYEQAWHYLDAEYNYSYI